MNKLPYLQPDRELYYNLGVLLLIIEALALTKHQKKILTIDKIQTFYFLVTRPVFLNKVLELANKNKIEIDESDFYTVDTLAVNVDELFDRDRLLLLIKLLSSKKYLSVSYSDKEGFVFELSASGQAAALDITCGYFQKIRKFLTRISSLQSESPSKLNGYINVALKQGI